MANPRHWPDVCPDPPIAGTRGPRRQGRRAAGFAADRRVAAGYWVGKAVMVMMVERRTGGYKNISREDKTTQDYNTALKRRPFHLLRWTRLRRPRITRRPRPLPLHRWQLQRRRWTRMSKALGLQQAIVLRVVVHSQTSSRPSFRDCLASSPLAV